MLLVRTALINAAVEIDHQRMNKFAQIIGKTLFGKK